MMPPSMDSCQRALSAYFGPLALAEVPFSITPLGDGLINDTFKVDDVRRAAPGWVLQRVNPIFGSAVHEDIEAITRHLTQKGLPTPLLVRSRAGALFVEEGAAVFRLMDYVPGQTHSIMRRELCREAGHLVGRFHEALSDLSHELRFVRPGAHDLSRHLQTLREARSLAAGRPDTAPAFFPLADEVLERGADLPEVAPGPLRLCHGDLKLSNLRFDEDGRGLCLLDLDTLSRLPLCIELGDALRSWCNPLGEDHPEARFDLDLFREALSGYGAARGAAGAVTEEEWRAIVPGARRIALELSARFLADVIGDAYFRYDPARYPSRAAHNLARARGQLSLSRSIAEQEDEAQDLLRELRR